MPVLQQVATANPPPIRHCSRNTRHCNGQTQGNVVPIASVRLLLLYDHVNRLGRHAFTLPGHSATGELWPLRHPADREELP
jgi:hypothetical protein